MLGFSNYDFALIIFCTVGSVIGSFAQAIVLTIDLKQMPRTETDLRIASPEMQELRGVWLAIRMILGGILGLMVGLYFVGAIQETPTTLAKIIALSIMLGYVAPKVWHAQERIVSAEIDRLANGNSVTRD